MGRQNPAPQGSLTGPQLRIMQIVWAADADGVSVADIWRQDADQELARTTILTVVQRLERRGWLVRKGTGRKLRFVAGCTREQAMGRLSAEFVDEFFEGSAANLILTLVDSRGISSAEAKHLRKIIAESAKGQP